MDWLCVILSVVLFLTGLYCLAAILFSGVMELIREMGRAWRGERDE